MALPPTSPSSSATSGTSPTEGSSSGMSQAASKKMGKQDFLKLLVAQLGNQDPMNPMKGQEFAAQLAQFSSVEQLTNISDQIGSQKQSNQALAQSVNSGIAAGMIGRTIEAPGNQVAWTGEGETTLGLDLSAPADEVTVKIRNASGSVVTTQTLEDVPSGAKEIKWKGTTEDGGRLPEGTYSFTVSATDAQGEPIEASTYRKGAVDRVTFGEEGTQLWVDGAKIPMGEVRSVAAPEAAE